MKKLFITQALVLMLLPAAAFAQYNSSTGGGYNSSTGGGYNSSTGIPGSYVVLNPLNENSFCGLLQKILNAIVAIGIPVAVLFLVLVGFQFILARGRPEALATARRNLLHTIIGIAIFIGAWAIIQVIISTMAQFGISLAACQV